MQKDESRTFPFGVASGDPGPASLILWTFVAGGSDSVQWSIDIGNHRIQSGTVTPREGVVRIEVSGLRPATDYCYRFTVAGVQSPLGEARTLPDGADTFRLAVVSCSRWPSGNFDLYRSVAESKPDLVLHLGDYIYSDGLDGPRGDHDPPRECRTTQDYERRYRQYRSDPDLRALHRCAPWVTLWDDHEFTDDAWTKGAVQGGRRGAEWDERRAAATDTYRRWMPQREHGNGPTPIDRLLHLGSLADLIVIDTRMAGRERPPGGAGGPHLEPRDDPPRSLLTEAQWQWLEDVTAASTADHLLLASSVQMAPLRLAPVPAPKWPPVRWLINPDQWDGYPSERRRLLDLLAKHGRSDAVVLSEDLHARFEISAGSGRLREVTTPSITATPFADSVRAATIPMPTRLLESWLRLWNPHIESIDLSLHGATIVDVSSTGLQISPLDPGETSA